MYVAVASFSETADGLGQWRGYCPNGAGYNLGFVAEDLTHLRRRQGFRLARCRYDDASQTQAIAKTLEGVRRTDRWAEALQQEDLDQAYRAAVNVWVLRFAPAASTIKQRSFREEREWRLISVPRPFSDNRWRVRPGRTMLIPYRPIKLTLDSSYLPIRELVVGPTPHMEQALRAGGVLLEPKLDPVPIQAPMLRQPAQIRNSRVPYRQWT